MRVSSQQILDAGINSIQQQSVEAMKWQHQISSGKKYARASDGAVAVARGVEIQFDQSKYDMFLAKERGIPTEQKFRDWSSILVHQESTLAGLLVRIIPGDRADLTVVNHELLEFWPH